MADKRKGKKPASKRDKYIEPGRRIMDNAYLRDGSHIHTGEALVLACLLHAKGKTARGNKEVEHLGKMLNDPNVR